MDRLRSRSIPVPGLRLATLLTALVIAASCAQEAPARPPNILLIVVDTLRADHLGCYGHPRDTSPNLDQLASQGVLFRHSISQSSWTLPSMISLMTGKYIFAATPMLPPNRPVLAERLKHLGYGTAAFVGNDVVGREEGFARGFDHFQLGIEILPKSLSIDTMSLSRAGQIVSNVVLRWTDRHLDPERPFFLYVHYIDPHHPYVPLPKYAQFTASHDPVRGVRRSRFDAFLEEQPEYRDTADEEVARIRRTIRLYDGEVRFVDEAIGRLLDGLREQGHMDHTLVVFTADHGEGLYERRRYPSTVRRTVPEEARALRSWFFNGHGHQVYDELIRVPLIVAGPGIAGGRVVDAVVASLDIQPTLLAAAGAADALDGDGVNLWPFLTRLVAPPPEHDVVYSFCNEVTAVVAARRKLKLLRPNRLGIENGEQTSMFDLASDPLEDVNLLDPALDPALLDTELLRAARYLEARLTKREQQAFREFAPADYMESTKEKMRALGYIR